MEMRSLCFSAVRIWLLAAAPFSYGIPVRTEPADVSGSWDLTVESQGGTSHPSITLKQDGERISGTYEGKLEGRLEGTIKGNEINFSLSLKFEDVSYTVTYSGTVAENSMKGTVRFGDSGTGSWSAVRKKSRA